MTLLFEKKLSNPIPENNKVFVELFGNGVGLCNTTVEFAQQKKKITVQTIAIKSITQMLAEAFFKSGNESELRDIRTSSSISDLILQDDDNRNLKICFVKISPHQKTIPARIRQISGYKIPIIIPLIAALIWILNYKPLGSDEVCFGNLGCFSLDEPWTSRGPIFHFVPQSPTAVKTSFTLFSREIPIGKRISKTSEHLGNWNSKRLIFIIHGYMDDSSSWMSQMKNSLLIVHDANIVLVDWRFGARMYYPQVVANTRIVAAEISIFIGKLSGISAQDIHLVGHSLGSHIVSYVGKQIQGIGKITALDPAFPLFEGYDASMRLEASDANVVEVFHSNIGPIGFGFREPLGTIDIYLNDARDQPGCIKMYEIYKRPVTAEGFANIQDDVACSHRRAYEVYEDIIRRNVNISVYRCNPWTNALISTCEVDYPMKFSLWNNNPLQAGAYKMIYLL